MLFNAVVLVLHISVILAATISFPSRYNHTVQVNGVSLSWEINANILVMKLVSPSSGWIGIAFDPSFDGMSHGDMFIATTENGQVSIGDYYCSSQSMPKLDTQLGGMNSVLAGRGTASPLVMEFARSVSAMDKYDNSINTAGPMALSIAWGSSPQISKHSMSDCSKFSLDLSTGAVSSADPTLVTAHAVIMAIAFGFLMSIGILVSLYLKKFHWWFPLHVALQTVASTLAIVGFALGFVIATYNFSKLHHWLGFFTVILVLIQPLLGGLADKYWDPSRDRVPIFPDLIHWIVGYIAIILSISAVITGFLLLNVSNSYLVIYCIWTFLILVSFIVGFILRSMSRMNFRVSKSLAMIFFPTHDQKPQTVPQEPSREQAGNSQSIATPTPDTKDTTL